MSERKNALDPAVAFFAFGSLASLAPEHRESNHALAKIIGWPHSLFRQEKKQAVHFVFHSASVVSCSMVLTEAIVGNESQFFAADLCYLSELARPGIRPFWVEMSFCTTALKPLERPIAIIDRDSTGPRPRGGKLSVC